MNLIYSNKRRVFSLACASLALGLPGCDLEGDLGKDSAADSSADSAGDSSDDSQGDDTADSDSGGGSSASDSGASDTGDETGGRACGIDDCGPAPGADPMCADGTSGTWVCAEMTAGCGWVLEDCPTSACSEDECGPAPGAPAQLCPDGVNYSGPGPCERNADGVCGWTFTECPACCDEVALPDCPEPITCCGDGRWVCGDSTACGEEGEALACAGGACAAASESCANGETCCGGLTCCEGVPVEPGQEFCSDMCPISDRNKKANFASVDVDEVLAKVGALEISTWNYTFGDPSVRHLGPMAQDFKAAFEIGQTDKMIFQIDADGVALASIQALDRHVKNLEAQNEELRSSLRAMQARLDALESKR